jgi:starch phosphorylase
MGTEVSTHDGRLDVERAIRSLSERLPEPLWPLARIAYNYRWTWFENADAVFREIHPSIWRRSGNNPRDVIEAVPPHHLQALAQHSSYVTRVHELAARLEADLRRPCAQTCIPPDRPVAYFCSEFGIHASLPLYGGGLGILAGDVLKTASDLALPMVGVGLLYREGYFHQRLEPSGWQHEHWTNTHFERLPVVRVSGPDREPLNVELVLRGRTVRIKLWRVDVGRVPLFLLDTERDDNHPIDRWIANRLYVGDRQTRLAQYALLGIGGTRALEALGIHPSVVHLNEGHAALGSFERLRKLLAIGLSFDEAMAQVRSETVFTTHTPVAAGNEGYREEEVEAVLSDFVDHLGIPLQTFYDLGRVQPGNRDEPANITPLALRTSRASNGVSRRHGEVARGMWDTLWPGRAAGDVPIGHITNGVHTLSWMAPVMQSLLDRHLPPDWRLRDAEPAVWRKVLDIPDEELWQVRSTLRQQLIDVARERSVRDRLARGEPPEYVEAALQTFNPQWLTIGFARRIATYKRFYLLSRFRDRLLHLLGSDPRPVQFVLAGKAHPQDVEAKESLRYAFGVKEAAVVGRRIIFLEDYDLYLAPRVVAGVDLWLNLPRPPLEASGTSGMKVTLNGGLNLSVLDGWWPEGFDGQNGWGIESPGGDPAAQDDHDAAALFELLQHQVLPLFYDRDARGIPRGWLQRVKYAMSTLIPRFSATRMLGEYVERMYMRGSP